MLLTLTTTHAPATDLGYLLHKHPDRAQSFPLSFGAAHVVFPEADEARCTAALVLDIDPVAMVRDRKNADDSALAQYVNDRPWVASSFLSVAIAQVFGTALSGRCAKRPELVEAAIPLRATMTALPCRGGVGLVRRLFEPLGYTVDAEPIALDETVPAWGASRYATVTLSGTVTLAAMLSHLYVLVPVLDDDKHYFVSGDEIDKLLRHGGAWLAAHPERELIASRYLKHLGRLTREALQRLSDDEDPDARAAEAQSGEEAVEAPMRLDDVRRGEVIDVLRREGVTSVVDLGCGEGRLLAALLKVRGITRITGVDVSLRALEIARERLDLDRASDALRARLQLLHGSVTYRDARLKGHEAAVAVEVVEHLDTHRLDDFARVLLADVGASLAVVTTPNAEYNARFPDLAPGKMRHRDHRFEWTRAEFARWCDEVAARHGHAVSLHTVGPEDPVLGSPTQMAVFRRGVTS